MLCYPDKSTFHFFAISVSKQHQYCVVSDQKMWGPGKNARVQDSNFLRLTFQFATGLMIGEIFSKIHETSIFYRNIHSNNHRKPFTCPFSKKKKPMSSSNYIRSPALTWPVKISLLKRERSLPTTNFS